jgi:hypothetical protein
MKQILLSDEQLQFLKALLRRELKELDRISQFYSAHDKATIELILEIIEDTL